MLWNASTVETVLKQTKVQMELVQLQCNSILKEKFSYGVPSLYLGFKPLALSLDDWFPDTVSHSSRLQSSVAPLRTSNPFLYIFTIH
jgi:hypothetical protein